jgi:hypothetical protein
MLGRHFYHEIIKKNVKAFGTVFNNIEIVKTDPETDAEIQRQKVPLAYGPKSKFLARLDQDPSTERKVSITLPRISFEMVDLQYDPSRKTSPIQKYLKENSGTSVKVQYMPVPYNLKFELAIISKNQDDALQILEQIIPYFQPAFTVTINLIPEMDEKKDLPIVLNGISYEDDYQDDMMRRRSITYTLDFTLKTYFYGPVTNSEIIRKATVFESIGDLDQHRRTIKYTVEPEALTDKNDDDVVNNLDDALLMPGDDFGFNEGIEIL